MDHGHREIWIDAEPHDVYRYLADFRQHPRWRPRLSVEPAPDGPASVGDTYRTRGRHPERHRQNVETVTRLEPGEIVEFEGLDRTLGTFHHAFRLERSQGGTHVVRTAAAHFRCRMLRLLRPVVYRTLVPHMLGRDLRALKTIVEGDTSDDLTASGSPPDPSDAP
jgi:uncharacterized protein YndB with AHSA1/START domain